MVCTPGEGPRRRGLGLASPRAQPARPSRCSAPSQPKPAPRRRRSGREEAGRAPRPRRPRSQGQLHSSLQTVTSSPAHPSPRSPLRPSPPFLRRTAGSILSSAPGNRGRGQPPLGTSRGFSHAARPPPGRRGEPSAPCNAARARRSPGRSCQGPRGLKTGRTLLHTLQDPRSCSVLLNPAPRQCSHPGTPSSRSASCFQGLSRVPPVCFPTPNSMPRSLA